MFVSVIVCTHNRASILPEVLASLGSQTLPANAFEIVMVDNNSTDRTREVVEHWARELTCLRTVAEAETGLSHARNAGWKAARAVYVVYTDDDCKLPTRWLEKAKKIIEAQQPNFFGGPCRPFYLNDRPAWFKDEYGSGGLGPDVRWPGPNEFLTGGNLFARRELLQRVGGFDPNFGMSGDRVAYGEDPETQMRIRRLVDTPRVYYDPDLFVYHLTRPDKMTYSWMTRSFFAKGRDVYRLRGRVPDEGRERVLIDSLRTTIKGVGDLILGSLFRDRHRYPFFANYFHERIGPYLKRLGRNSEKLSVLRRGAAR